MRTYSSTPLLQSMLAIKRFNFIDNSREVLFRMSMLSANPTEKLNTHQHVKIG